MIEGIFKRSFERVAQQPPGNTLIDSLMLGWWRIRFTEPLIAKDLAYACSADDIQFWRDAQAGEAGHATLYEQELRESLGEKVFVDLAAHMLPCPAVEDLIEWVKLDSINHVVYRAWLEHAVTRQPESAVAMLSRFIPKSIALHAALDRQHAQDCFRYLQGKVDYGQVTAQAIFDKCELVGMALRNELNHHVFPATHYGLGEAA